MPKQRRVTEVTCAFPVQGAIEDKAEIGSFRNGKNSVIAKFYRDVRSIAQILDTSRNSIS